MSPVPVKTGLTIRDAEFQGVDQRNNAILHFKATVGNLERRSVSINRSTGDLKFYTAPWDASKPPAPLVGETVKSLDVAAKLFQATPEHLRNLGYKAT